MKTYADFPHPRAAQAFTLIELSIVLVIVGLIVGGMLVGRDLIAAAAVRAQITQIEKYNQAVNTFRGKYDYLPGDIPNPYAARFGFQTRGTSQGQGDGNGIIEAYCGGPPNTCGVYPFWGEEAMFWVDLAQANLIEGGFSTATPTATTEGINGAAINNYLPASKINNNGYVYVYSGGWQEINNMHGYSNPPDAQNYFGIAAVTGFNGTNIFSLPLLTVAQAYAIDKKTDDGLPQSGRVMATTLGTWSAWAAGGSTAGTAPYIYETATGQSDNIGGPIRPASTSMSGTTAGATSCYDGAAQQTQQYSIVQNNGAGINCMLSFRFQ